MSVSGGLDVGASVADALGSRVEMAARPSSPLMTAAVGALAIGAVFTVVDMLSTPPPTQDEQRAAAAREEALTAERRRDEAIRQASFAKPPGMG